MAIGLSHHLLRVHTLQHNNSCLCYSSIPPSKPPATLVQNPNCSLRTRTVPKSSPHKNPNTSVDASAQESKPPISRNGVKRPDPSSASDSSFSSSFSFILRPIREKLKFDELGMEILAIALPAALALAADPIASLVDTAFVGHLGSAELAAIGVSVSVFNLVSKLFNVPLLNVTTSFVAEEQALVTKGNDESVKFDQVADQESKKVIPSVSTSLLLAAGIGIAEAVALSVGSGFLMNTMGIPVDSPMRVPAEQFLSLRAFGAPPIVIALAAQGTFRGFKDTKTPLYAVGKDVNAINCLNMQHRLGYKHPMRLYAASDLP